LRLSILGTFVPANTTKMIDLFTKKVFIVDDDELVLKSYARALQKKGFEDIETFESGVDCIRSLHKKPFIVLLDYQMDKLNGFEVLMKIRRYNPKVYVIMLSAQKNVQNAVDTLKYGAFDYIIKSNEDVDLIFKAFERIDLIERDYLVPKPTLISRLLGLA
jgi:DNA-binding NtrC family response regulator